jgi:hypothetical protein
MKPLPNPGNPMAVDLPEYLTKELLTVSWQYTNNALTEA